MSEQATAYHEAGHAVARFVLRRGIDGVSIVADEREGSLGEVQGPGLPWLGDDWAYTPRRRRSLEDEIVTALAGPVAEERFLGRANPDGAEDDRSRAGDLAMHLGGPDFQPYLDDLDAKARALIDERWNVVEALAAELQERKVLCGPAALRIMREAYSGGR